MNKINFKILVIALLAIINTSCDDNYFKSKYTVTTTDNSGQILYVFHTDSIKINNDGSISFIPKEDSTKIYTLDNYNINKK